MFAMQGFIPPAQVVAVPRQGLRSFAQWTLIFGLSMGMGIARTTAAFAAPPVPPEPPQTTPGAASQPPSVEPLPSPTETTTPSATAPPAIAEAQPVAPAVPASTVALDVTAAAPVVQEPDPPIFEKWWFWTAIGAFAVTAVVIIATSSGPTPPRTDLGNMTAF